MGIRCMLACFYNRYTLYICQPATRLLAAPASIAIKLSTLRSPSRMSRDSKERACAGSRND